MLNSICDEDKYLDLDLDLLTMLRFFIRRRPPTLHDSLHLLQSAKLLPIYSGSTTTQCRYIFTLKSKHIFKAQHSKDKVPKDYNLIYVNNYKNILGPCRVLASAVGIFTGCASLSSLFIYKDTLESWDVFSLSGVSLWALFSIVFVNLVSRYYLMRIYFLEDGGRFIGIYHSFFGNVKHVRYTTADIHLIQPSSQKAPLHVKSNVNIGGRTFHLKGNEFILPKYYNMHLGQV